MIDKRRDVFQAIADPTRRAILCLIATKAMTAGALAEHFEVSRQAVSKHLQILSECELVKPENKGREMHYHIQMNKMKEIDQWLAQFRLLWEGRFTELDRVLEQLKNKPI